jgi:hypothetical protein
MFHSHSPHVPYITRHFNSFQPDPHTTHRPLLLRKVRRRSVAGLVITSILHPNHQTLGKRGLYIIKSTLLRNSSPYSKHSSSKRTKQQYHSMTFIVSNLQSRSSRHALPKMEPHPSHDDDNDDDKDVSGVSTQLPSVICRFSLSPLDADREEVSGIPSTLTCATVFGARLTSPPAEADEVKESTESTGEHNHLIVRCESFVEKISNETESPQGTFPFPQAKDGVNNKRRCVRFDPVVIEHDLSTTYSSLEDRRSRWYTKTELNAMRQATVQLALYTSSHFGQSALPRGLECCTIERLKHKARTIKCVLLVCEKMKQRDNGRATTTFAIQQRQEHYVSQISTKLTKWNVDLAFVQGCRDYFELYDPPMLLLSPTLSSVGPPPNINIVRRKGNGKKSKTDESMHSGHRKWRHHSDEHEQERRVRARVHRVPS